MTKSNNLTSLSVSCVFYDTDEAIFRTTLISLAKAVNEAKLLNVLGRFELHLINNNPKQESFFPKIVADYVNLFERVVTHNGHGNIGYGCANNLAIEKTEAKYHLILNPDVELEPDALTIGISYLEAHPEVSLVAPNAQNQFGEIEYLAKRTPSFLLIFLRGLNNSLLNRLFQKKLDRYAYMDMIPSKQPVEIEHASGCFMLCKARTLKMCGGFSPEFFLYFEDFDLSKKITEFGKVFHLPLMKIRHQGGGSAKKGLRHIKLFFSSYLTFRKKFG